jgi:4-alpha-glucanotransferase
MQVLDALIIVSTSVCNKLCRIVPLENTDLSEEGGNYAFSSFSLLMLNFLVTRLATLKNNVGPGHARSSGW